MTNDLLPCPFCGGEAYKKASDVFCENPRCGIYEKRLNDTAWSTRTPNKPAEVDLDALKVEVGQNVISDQFTVNRVIDYLASTGRIRGDRPDCEEMAHAAACLLLQNNGVSDTVWYRADRYGGTTLYDFLASYSGKELTGVVEDDYEILTGEKYPLPAAPGGE